MKRIFKRSARRFSFFACIVSVLTASLMVSSNSCNRSYAQVTSIASGESLIDHVPTMGAPSNIGDELFFGARVKKPTSNIVDSTPYPLRNDVAPAHANSSSIKTLRKFFGLEPIPDRSYDATVNFRPNFFKRFQNQSERSQRLPNARFIQSSSTGIPERFDSFPRETNGSVMNIGQELRQNFEYVPYELKSTAYDLQSQDDRASHYVGNQLLESQNKFEGEYVDVEHDAQRRAFKKGFTHDLNTDPKSYRSNVGNVANLSNQKELSERRRRRLDELNAILAARSPNTFTRHEQYRALYNDTSENNPVDKMNNSKIRQASNIEKKSEDKINFSVSKQQQQLPLNSNKAPLTGNSRRSKPNPLSRNLENQSSGPYKLSPQSTLPEATDVNVFNVTNRRAGHNNSIQRTNQHEGGARFPENKIDSSKVTPSQRNECNPTSISPQPNPNSNNNNAPVSENYGQSFEKTASHDVTQTGVIRSSAKFIDPKDI